LTIVNYIKIALEENDNQEPELTAFPLSIKVLGESKTVIQVQVDKQHFAFIYIEG
jgi:hypothetical protein